MSSKTANKDAAIDINAVLTPDPPIDVKTDEDSIKKELVELLSNIKKGDTLTPATWKTLKSLGWKDTTEKVEKLVETETAVKAKPEAKAKKAKATKTPVVRTKIGRMETLGKVLASGTYKEEDVITKADALYVKNDGKTNITLFTSLYSDARSLLRGLNILEEKNGKVSIRK